MGNRYVTFDSIANAPVITFLWTTKFPIGFYAPAVLPVLIGFVVSGVETIGDLTATGEASGLEPGSAEQARAVQVRIPFPLPTSLAQCCLQSPAPCMSRCWLGSFVGLIAGSAF